MKAKQFEQARSEAKLTNLPGQWFRCDAVGHPVGLPVELKVANGFWGIHKHLTVRVFVITTGPNKGVWRTIGD